MSLCLNARVAIGHLLVISHNI